MRDDIVAPTCANVVCNPLRSLRRARAPTCADVTAKSLKSLRRRCVVHVPIILRIIIGRRLLAAGGPIQIRTVSANAAASVRSFPAGHRTCTLTTETPKIGAVVDMVVEWFPNAPTGFSRHEWRQYRFGRRGAVSELARQTGMKAAVVEL